MALVLKDRVKQAAAAPGTGTITLGATAAGFQSFASVGNGNTTYFAIVDPISGAWEVNYGVYTSSGTTLTRNATPLSSSTGTLVNFTGAVDVFVTYPSENAVWRDTAGVVVQQSFGAITATSAALTSGTITGAPVNATDIVNKEYADSIASGLNYHQPVNYASTAALPAYTYNNGASGVGATITANANGALSLGGGSPTATQRVLVKDEVSGNAPYNGIYVVTQAGSAGTPFILTRATDYDTSGTGTNEIDAGDYVLVISGTLASTAWVQQTPLPITVGTTALTFLQFNAPITYTAGTGLNLSPATTFNISNTGVTATTYGSASAVPVVTFNAQGQATGVTNTTIAIAGSQVSGNISGQAGSVANALTLGTYLTGGTYNGSAAVTATVDATSANTASKVVARDASGNFSAGTITATLSGSSTSATTATNLAGGAANQIPYQTGSGATSFITAASGTNTVLNFNGSAFSWSAGTISGVPLGSNLNSLTAGTYLTGTAYNGSAAQTWTVDATSANTASKVVARDASGNFSASTITASLSGNATTATTATNQSGGTVSATTGAFTSDVVIGGGDLTVYRAGGATGVLYLNSAQNRYLYWNSATYELAGAELNINGNRALNAGNYNSYAPTLTGTGASGTWGINITGSAGSATTLANFTATTSSSGFNPDSPPTIDQIGYWYGGYTLYGYSDGGLYTSGYSTAWYHQISGDFRSGQIAVRGKNSGTWQSWYYIPTYSLNNGYSTGSLYAGIYYDANNTAYYLDPASLSTLNRLLVYGGDSVSPTLQLQASVYPMLDMFSDNTNGNNRNWRLAGVYNSYGLFQILSSTAPNGTPSTARLGINGINGYVGIGAAATGPANWLQIGSVGSTGYSGNHIAIGDGTYVFAQYLNGGTSMDFYTNSAYFNFANQYTQMAGSSRAPIFYDSNNTGYYVDPASTTQLSTLYTAGTFYPASTANYASTTVTGLTSAPINTSNSIPNAGTTGTFYPLTNQLAYYSSGYVTHVNTGLYKDANGWNAGWYMAIGGNDSYPTEWFQLRYGATIQHSYGYVNIDGSTRSPIYYDLDNTAYYVNPASTTQLSTVYMDGWLYKSGTAGIYFTSYNYGIQAAGVVGSYGNIATYGTGQGGWSGYNLGGQWTLMNSSNGDNIGIHSNSTSWLWYWDGSLTNFYRGYTQFANSARAPIFYDSDNTGYYVNPAAYSYMYEVAAASYVYGGYLRSGTNVYTDQNYGYGLVGAYSSYRYQGVYAMGDVYKLPPDGTTTGSLYGMAWSHPNAGGAASNLNSHGLLLLQNGGFMAALSTNGTFSADVRGTVFYDYNNTSYYVDPASSSYISAIVADNWFRTVGLVGFYSQSYGSHFYPQSNGRYWTITGNGSTDYGALLFKTNYESTIKGYVYWDTSGYGLLHGNGGWSVRGNVGAVGGQFYGSWFSDTDLRAPIFYDYNDTSYYADPASTSSFNVIRSYALSYQGAVSDNNTWGMYFDNALPAAYAIYRAAGAWTHPYPDLRIAFHTGIQIGANASYGGVRFYDDYDMSTEVMSVNYGAVGLGANNVYVNNSLVAGSSLRAPIFYDSNNTGYYVDPASTSILNVLNCYGNVTAYYSSDIKFKTNVRDIPNALETVESIGGKLFDWTDEYIEEHGGEDDYFMRKEDFGVVAQDVLKVFPVAVRTRPDGSLAVDYEKLSALAFAAVAELSTRVKSLEARI